jgi:hypothetical protein
VSDGTPSKAEKCNCVKWRLILGVVGILARGVRNVLYDVEFNGCNKKS